MNPEKGYYIGEEDYVGNILLRYYREQKTHLRFGQYFVNRYMSVNTVWPELYYMTETADAITCITEYLNRILADREAR